MEIETNPIPNIPPGSGAVSRLQREPATVVLEARLLGVTLAALNPSVKNIYIYIVCRVSRGTPAGDISSHCFI